MSSEETAYNPIEYHNGTVWPHDTALIAEGMRRYGFRDEATRLVTGLLDAAAGLGRSLPELFAGTPRDATNVPVSFPGRRARKRGRPARRCSACARCSGSM